MATPVNSRPGSYALEAAPGEHLVEHETQGIEFDPVIDLWFAKTQADRFGGSRHSNIVIRSEA
jgi:hypothetical protein